MANRRNAPSLLLYASPFLVLTSIPAHSQETENGGEKRTRVILGPQLSPSWPGADKYSVGPYVDVSRTRDSEFAFEAPDESFGSPLIRSGNFAFGPAFGFIGKRKASDIGADLPRSGCRSRPARSVRSI